MPKFKRTTLLLRMPKSQPLKLHFFLRIKSPSHCLKPKQLLRSILYTCGKNHGLTTTQAVTSDLQPMVSRKAYRSLYGRKAESKVNRLKMGHSLLKQHLHRIAMIDNPTCDCETDRETPEHIIFHCQNNDVHRDTLIDTIELSLSIH